MPKPTPDPISTDHALKRYHAATTRITEAEHTLHELAEARANAIRALLHDSSYRAVAELIGMSAERVRQLAGGKHPNPNRQRAATKPKRKPPGSAPTTPAERRDDGEGPQVPDTPETADSDAQAAADGDGPAVAGRGTAPDTKPGAAKPDDLRRRPTRPLRR